MPTIFERIVAGEIPCHRVWEDDNHLAFLDINPCCNGHTLVIPKRATDYVFDLPPDEYHALWLAAQCVAEKLKQKLGCLRVLIGVWGFEVPHAHIHLFPVMDMHQCPMPPKDPDAKARLAETAALLAP